MVASLLNDLYLIVIIFEFEFGYTKMAITSQPVVISYLIIAMA